MVIDQNRVIPIYINNTYCVKFTPKSQMLFVTLISTDWIPLNGTPYPRNSKKPTALTAQLIPSKNLPVWSRSALASQPSTFD
jgi:hypothetical protein